MQVTGKLPATEENTLIRSHIIIIIIMLSITIPDPPSVIYSTSQIKFGFLNETQLELSPLNLFNWSAHTLEPRSLLCSIIKIIILSWSIK